MKQLHKDVIKGRELFHTKQDHFLDLTELHKEQVEGSNRTPGWKTMDRKWTKRGKTILSIYRFQTSKCEFNCLSLCKHLLNTSYSVPSKKAVFASLLEKKGLGNDKEATKTTALFLVEGISIDQDQYVIFTYN